MARSSEFTTGTVVTAAFLDALQDAQSALAHGVVLELASSTQVRCRLATDGTVTGQTSIIINGLVRYITTNAGTLTTVSGSAGTYNVYAVAGAGPDFTLTVLSGAGPTNSRKIGEVVWSGSAVTELRQMVDAVSGHGYSHRVGGTDPLPIDSVDTPQIVAGSVTGAKINAALSDPVAGTAGLRTLGTGAQQATAGNDSRLTNTRTPSAASITPAMLVGAPSITSGHGIVWNGSAWVDAAVVLTGDSRLTDTRTPSANTITPAMHASGSKITGYSAFTGATTRRTLGAGYTMDQLRDVVDTLRADLTTWNLIG